MHPLIYTCGCWERADFSEPREWLNARFRVRHFEGFSELAAAITGGEKDPDGILLIQSRPGEYQEERVRKLQARVPLTAVSVLLSSWCEGETRSGTPLSNVMRLPWHVLSQQLNHRLRSPRTAAAEDQLLSALHQSHASVARRIAVYSADHAQAAALCETLSRSGHDARPLPAAANLSTTSFQPQLVLWDDVGGARRERVSTPPELAKAFGVSSDVPCIALRGFARIQDHERDKAAGFVTTIAKPFHVADLLQQIERALDPAYARTWPLSAA